MTQNKLILTLLIGILTTFIIQVIKRYYKGTQPTTRMVQLITMVIGVVLSLIAMYFTNGNLTTHVIIGVIGGLNAQGLYDTFIKKVSTFFDDTVEKYTITETELNQPTGDLDTKTKQTKEVEIKPVTTESGKTKDDVKTSETKNK